jgi:hypothetical protein
MGEKEKGFKSFVPEEYEQDKRRACAFFIVLINAEWSHRMVYMHVFVCR